MLTLEANFQVQCTPPPASRWNKQTCLNLHPPLGTASSLSSSTFLKSNLYSLSLYLVPSIYSDFCPLTQFKLFSLRSQWSYFEFSGKFPVPFSLHLSVAFDTKEHFLISYTLCSASVTPSSPLPRFLLTISFWDPSSPFTLVLLRVPPLTDCSSHCTYSLIHSQSSNYHQELTPKSVTT